MKPRHLFATAALAGALALPNAALADHAVAVGAVAVPVAPATHCAVFTSQPAGPAYRVRGCIANVITVHTLPEYRHRHAFVQHRRVVAGPVIYIYD
jgi:uncharacterized protein YraI